jgi:hypothetical protein
MAFNLSNSSDLEPQPKDQPSAGISKIASGKKRGNDAKLTASRGANVNQDA